MVKEGTKPAKQKLRLKIARAQNDAKYAEMGRLLRLKVDPDSEAELAGMNLKKNGRPCHVAYARADRICPSRENALGTSPCGVESRP